jgi:hypothetical protein
MARVDRRRADICALVRQATREASMRGRRIDTVDPILICAKRMYPYLSDGVLHEYSRTALRVITNSQRRADPTMNPQTTLFTHLIRR